MSETAARRAPIVRRLPALLAAGALLVGPAHAADPIRIGVIAEAQSVAGGGSTAGRSRS